MCSTWLRPIHLATTSRWREWKSLMEVSVLPMVRPWVRLDLRRPRVLVWLDQRRCLVNTFRWVVFRKFVPKPARRQDFPGSKSWNSWLEGFATKTTFVKLTSLDRAQTKVVILVTNSFRLWKFFTKSGKIYKHNVWRCCLHFFKGSLWGEEECVLNVSKNAKVKETNFTFVW